MTLHLKSYYRSFSTAGHAGVKLTVVGSEQFYLQINKNKLSVFKII